MLLRMAGHIEDGWHLYSMSTPAAIPTKIQLAPNPAIEKVRALQPPPKRAFDANFNSDTETYEGDVAFLLEPPGNVLGDDVRRDVLVVRPLGRGRHEAAAAPWPRNRRR